MFSRILVVAIVIFLIVTFLGKHLPDWLTFSLITVLSGSYAFYEYKRRIKKFIDLKIASIAGFRTKFQFYTVSYSQYRYVDIYNIVNNYISQFKDITVIETTNNGYLLSYLMDIDWFGDKDKHITKGTSMHFKISHEEEIFVPKQRIWVVKKGEKEYFVLHLMFYEHTYLEIACLEEEFADEFIALVNKESVKNSIYKNKLLSLHYDSEIQGNESGTMNYRGANIAFLPPKVMTEDSIVLEEEIATIIKRNIFDFFAHKDKLAAQNVPLHRGFLFYGSPGTGKTYTCHYISHTLKDATCIVASGDSLTHIKSVCNLARMLQPALVILEDVDLVFASREINAYGGTLGELMDQLDGFKADDNIVFILTTNSLDRIESAIKNRPGRINQIIHFDVPTKNLRFKHFQNYLLPYDISDLDVSALAQKVDGVSQAFIKDLVFRAVQIALEENNYQDVEKVCLQMHHFDVALREIIKYNNQAAYSILKYKDDIL